jgi:hypothetical protein
MSSTAHVSLYRKPRYWGFLMRFPVYVDNQQVGKVANGERQQFDVSPGQHDIAVKLGFLKTKAAQFTATPDKTVPLVLDSVPSLLQMVLSPYYMITRTNFWITEEKA